MSENLAQTLLAEQLVSAEILDEAQRRQVVHEGSLDTNLLELGAVAEADLLRALGDTYRLPVGEKSDIDGAEAHIPRLFPLQFAEAYRMVPTRLVGANLNVLVNSEPDPQLFGRVRDRLRLNVNPTVTTEARLHYAMHRLYATRLLPRFEQLLAKLDGAPPTPLYEPASSDHMLSWGLPSGRINAGANRGAKSAPDIAALLARLDSAPNRDSVVEILLEIAVGVFDYVCLFAVQGDKVNGWRGTAPEETARVARISIPVSEPSAFQTIYATHGHHLGPLAQNSFNEDFLLKLGRNAPRTALLAPILVGGKLAAIIYADNGSRPVPSKRVSGVLLLAHRVGMCLERLIRRRKRQAAAERSNATDPQAASVMEPLSAPETRGAPKESSTSSGTATQPGRDRSAAPPPLPGAATATIPSSIQARQATVPPPQTEPGEDDLEILDLDEVDLVATEVEEIDIELELEHDLADEDEVGAPSALIPDPSEEDADDGYSAVVVSQDLEVVPFSDFDDPEPASGDAPLSGSLAAQFAAGLKARQAALVAAKESSDGWDDVDVDDGYVAFSDISETPERSLADWEDVLVDAVSDEQEAAPQVEATVGLKPTAPPAVSWHDVITEAESAPSLDLFRQRTSIEVAGTSLDTLEVLFDALSARDAETRAPAIEELAAMGSGIDTQIQERFPGALHFDPFASDAPIPAFAQCSGICALLERRGPSAAGFVASELESDDPRRRFFAIYFFLAVYYPAALDSLARRLYDSEPRNRYLAADALRGYTTEEAYARILQSLRDQLRVPVLDTQITTVQVLGQLRDPRAVPSLIPLVVSPHETLVHAATSSLAVICAQAHGHDVTRWADWWRASFSKPRECWLVDGLRHPNPAIQRIAFTELQLLTGYSGTFNSEGSAEEKEPIIQVWESWLQQLESHRAQYASA